MLTSAPSDIAIDPAATHESAAGTARMPRHARLADANIVAPPLTACRAGEAAVCACR